MQALSFPLHHSALPTTEDCDANFSGMEAQGLFRNEEIIFDKTNNS
jgi:hypothetical protein